MSTALPLLTVSEAAAILGVSRHRAYQLVADGRIPAIRLSPRRIRVPRAALESWLGDQAERALANLSTAR